MTDIRCHKRNEINTTCEIRKYRSVYCNKFYEIIMRYEKEWPIFTTKKDNQFWEYFTYFQVKYIKNLYLIFISTTLSVCLSECVHDVYTQIMGYTKNGTALLKMLLFQILWMVNSLLYVWQIKKWKYFYNRNYHVIPKTFVFVKIDNLMQNFPNLHYVQSYLPVILSEY